MSTQVAVLAPRQKNESADAYIARLEAHNAALVAAKGKQTITPKVSVRTGALTIYGLRGRFPVTFYLKEWETLQANMDKINKFVDENKAKFSQDSEESDKRKAAFDADPANKGKAQE